MAFALHKQDGLHYHTSTILAHDGVAHGFSTRLGGVSEGCFASLNLRISCGDDPRAVNENYRRFCAALGVDAERTVLTKQVHSDTVRPVTAEDAGKGLLRPRDYETDALVTNVPGMNLMVFSADCGIFLLHDPVTGCVGAVHAGWRGTALDLPAKTVREMGRLYGAKRENIRVAMGAGIGQCCFETDGDVPGAMHTAFGPGADRFARKKDEKWFVDLRGINLWRLGEAGILPEHREALDLCTACRTDLYWSHRRMGNARGVQAALIGLRGEGL